LKHYVVIKMLFGNGTIHNFKIKKSWKKKYKMFTKILHNSIDNEYLYNIRRVGHIYIYIYIHYLIQML
jgi:hypothetical protein